MLPKMVNTGSVPMAGMVDLVVVLVKDADDPEVEEEEEGHGDVERWPQVNSDPQELIFIEELPSRILLDREGIKQGHFKIKQENTNFQVECFVSWKDSDLSKTLVM